LAEGIHKSLAIQIKFKMALTTLTLSISLMFPEDIKACTAVAMQ
jgi:hypothetical protein